MTWCQVVEFVEELRPGLAVIAQGLDSDPALREEVIERRRFVRLLDADELPVRSQ
jgi:hypothetical protein